MNDFTYENQGTNTYLVYQVSEDDVIDSISLGMLTNNKISGLAPTFFTQLDTIKYIKYNVSSKISVQQFFSGPVNKKRLIGVFKGVTDAILSAEEYMIDINSILLDLNYIFADVSTCEAVLICAPIVNEKQSNIDLGVFFKNIMFTTQFDQTENCDYVARIINYLNSVPVFSLESFKELLSSIAKEAPTQPVVSQVKSTPAPQSAVSVSVKQPVVEKQQVTKVAPVAIPTQNATPAPPITPAVQVKTPNNPTQIQTSSDPVTGSANEKKMSMLNLLMHYNKENAALYKEQKNAKKEAKKCRQQQPVNPVVAQPPTNVGFAVPGQPNPVAGAVVASQPVQPKVEKVPDRKVAQNKPAVSPVVAQPVTPAPAVQSAFVPREVPQGNSMNFGETTVLGGGAIGETTVLTAANAPKQLISPHLIRSKNNERIALDKPVFRIGKERSYVDYFIGDNTAISRSHANIITRENEYFVVDTNSTNHTYVNGIMIQSGVETKITHGDKVKFANEDFEFKLY